MGLHHVQVSMPPGAEEEARAFHAGALGLKEVNKPPSLADRGGCWFRAFDGEVVVAEIHVGVEPGFAPGKKSHPAFVVESVACLEELAAGIQAAGFDFSWEERYTFECCERFHCRDPFGNRVEALTPRSGASRSDTATQAWGCLLREGFGVQEVPIGPPAQPQCLNCTGVA
ncbi:glyoxalase [Arthrobacter sp. AQ5-05]|uniref:VOC family protein n=1 Tax=Arthrobacter sp. AQ5-05 TaxID=2184581 RepID=UPI000DCBC9B0|nr:glyoxalase [Arthrobacter sp. AQ5-05]